MDGDRRLSTRRKERSKQASKEGRKSKLDKSVSYLIKSNEFKLN